MKAIMVKGRHQLIWLIILAGIGSVENGLAMPSPFISQARAALGNVKLPLFNKRLALTARIEKVDDRVDILNSTFNAIKRIIEEIKAHNEGKKNKLEPLEACLYQPNVTGAFYSLAAGDNGVMMANYKCDAGFVKVRGSTLASTCNGGVWMGNVDLLCMRQLDGFTLDEGAKLYYRIYKDITRSVEDAKEICRTYDPRGRLVVLNTAEKRDKIMSVLKGQGVGNVFLVGAERSPNGVFNRWVDGSPIDCPWSGREPDNYGENQNCADFQSASSEVRLCDDSCSRAFRFICDVPIF